MHTSTALLTKNEPAPDALDTEGGFSVGDCVSFEFHGGRITGYIKEFRRESYLFADRWGNCRTYAIVVQNWDRRHLKGYGHSVLLTELQTEQP